MVAWNSSARCPLNRLFHSNRLKRSVLVIHSFVRTPVRGLRKKGEAHQRSVFSLLLRDQGSGAPSFALFAMGGMSRICEKATVTATLSSPRVKKSPAQIRRIRYPIWGKHWHLRPGEKCQMQLTS
jgi:hypothetical protein